MLRLDRDADSLVVSPAHGGAILGWTRNGEHLPRRPTPASVLSGEPSAMGCFPLVPWCNRIAHGQFTWPPKSVIGARSCGDLARDHVLDMNFGDHPHAIHGLGWRRPWRVEAIGADSITLSPRHEPAPRAWPFTATLLYRLTGDGLTTEIAATNSHCEFAPMGPAPMGPAPMGIGAHPYFPGAPTPEITFQADGVWETRDSLPSHHINLPLPNDHTAGLDHCFTGTASPAGAVRPPGLVCASPPIPCSPIFRSTPRLMPISSASSRSATRQTPSIPLTPPR